jgi:hypothetical protein
VSLHWKYTRALTLENLPHTAERGNGRLAAGFEFGNANSNLNSSNKPAVRGLGGGGGGGGGGGLPGRPVAQTQHPAPRPLHPHLQQPQQQEAGEMTLGLQILKSSL